MKNRYFLLIGILTFSSLSVFAKKEGRGARLKGRVSVGLSKKIISTPSLSSDLVGVRKVINLRDVKPPNSGSFGFPPGTDLQELEQVTDESIKYLYNLAKRYKTDKDRADIWLRLARQYFEKSKLVKLKLHNRYHKNKKYKKNINFNSSYIYNKKSLKLYLWFLKTFPKDRRTEKVYTFAIKNYLLFDQIEAAASLYSPFLRKYPKSIYKEEVSFLVADYYFSKFFWKKSKAFYKKTLTSPTKKLKYLVYYKMAWVEHKMGRYKSAFYYLDLVLRNTSSNTLLSFRSAAIRDLPYFYSRYGPASLAEKLFLKYIPKKELSKPFSLLADYYFADGKKQDANLIWKKLIVLDPLAESNFDYAYKVIQSYKYRKTAYKNLTLIKAWLSNYGVNSSWFRRDPQLRKKYVVQQEKYLRYLISGFYKQKITKNKKKRVQNLLVLYPLYLKNFSSLKYGVANLLEMKFLYADVLFEKKKYGSAQRQYFEITALGKSKFYKKALYNQILCNEKRLFSYSQIKKKTKNFSKPLAIGGFERGFELSALEYLKVYKDFNLEYRLGLFYYNRVQLTLAEAMLKKYLQSSSGVKGSVKLQKQVLSWLVDIYSKGKEYSKIKSLFSENANLAKSQKFKSQKDRVHFKIAEELEKQKKYKEAIKEYAKVVLRKSNLLTSALFNQANLYFKLKQVNKSVALFKKIQPSKSKHLYKKAQLTLISIYRSKGLYLKVAQTLEALAKNNFKESASWLYNAGILRKALKHYKLAINNFSQFLSLNKNKKKTEEVKLILIDLHVVRNQLTQATKLLKAYYNFSNNKQIQYYVAGELIALYKKLNQISKAKWWEEKLLSEYANNRLRFKKYNGILAVVAKIKYNRAETAFFNLLKLKFKKQTNLQSLTKKKISLLDGVKKNLKAVVSLGNPEFLLKSLVLEARAQAHTAAFFSSLPVPQSLKGKDKKAYVAGVKNFTDPMLLESKKLYKLTLDKAYNFEFYSSSVVFAYHQLNTLKNKVKKVSISYVDRLVVKLISSGEFLYTTKYKKTFSSYTKMKSFALSSIINNQKDKDYWFVLVSAYIGLGFYELAELILEDKDLLRHDPDSYYNDRAILLRASGNVSQSFIFLKKVAKNNLYKKSYIGTNLAWLYANYAEFNKAKSILDFLKRKKYVFSIRDLNNYAIIEAMLGNTNAVKKIYKQTLSKDKENSLTLFNYSYWLFQNTKEYTNMLSALERAKVWNRNKKLLKLIKILENKIKGLI